MSIHFQDYEKMIFNQIKCTVCHSFIKNSKEMYQSRKNFTIICKNCKKKFSEDDLEFIINLFLLYGGYFGRFKKDTISLDLIFTDLLNKLKNWKLWKLPEDLELFNMILIHKMLLYGFTPQEYIEMLKKELKDI